MNKEEIEKDNRAIKISMPLLTEEEMLKIDNNFNEIVDKIKNQFIKEKDLAIAHIVDRIKELEAKQKEMCEEYCPKTERIKELEQENRIQRRQLNSAFDRGWIPKEKVKDLINENGFEVYTREYENVEVVSIETLEELLEESK